MRHTLRLLDANANRAREAMRVMEDTARFLLEDARLSKDLKQLRHDLAATLRPLHRLGFELYRNTPGDIGTAIGTPAEQVRGSTRQVIVAAGKRLTEALRCLEEYCKIDHRDVAAQVERLRYRAYEMDRRLHERIGSEIRGQWRLCVIVTESLCQGHDWFDVARAAAEAGADCIQLREKQVSDQQLLDRANRLLDVVPAGPPPFIILNDRPDVALLSASHGVHLGQSDLPPQRVRRLLGAQMLIGVSTHSLGESRRAVAAGADYCGVGAIFPTATKRRTPSGLKYLREFLAAHPHQPHLAIGGITSENISQVIDAGARGVAVSSVVCGAKKPSAVVGKLLRAIPPVKDSPMGGPNRRR